MKKTKCCRFLLKETGYKNETYKETLWFYSCWICAVFAGDQFNFKQFFSKFLWHLFHGDQFSMENDKKKRKHPRNSKELNN